MDEKNLSEKRQIIDNQSIAMIASWIIGLLFWCTPITPAKIEEWSRLESLGVMTAFFAIWITGLVLSWYRNWRLLFPIAMAYLLTFGLTTHHLGWYYLYVVVCFVVATTWKYLHQKK